MKWTIISLNIIAAIAFLFLGSVAASIHQVHSYSMYREFVGQGVIDEQKVKTLSQSSEHYDVVKRMQAIGNVKNWFGNISNMAAVACLANATVIYFMVRKVNGQKAVS